MQNLDFAAKSVISPVWGTTSEKLSVPLHSTDRKGEINTIRVKEGGCKILEEIARLYESGEKSNRIQAGQRIRTTANDYDLQDLVKILQDQQASIHEKMIAALSIGYHEESGNHELVILYEALKDARGEPRTYAYRVLSGIRKLLSKNIQCDNSVHYQPNRIEDVILYDVKLIGMITARIVEWYITSTI